MPLVLTLFLVKAPTIDKHTIPGIVANVFVMPISVPVI